jgi:signal transduction histidine kinase
MPTPPLNEPARWLSPLSWGVFWRQSLATLAALLGLGIVIAVLYQHDRHYERRLHEQQAQHRLDVGWAAITRVMSAVSSDLLYLSQQEALQQFLAGDESARVELAGEYQRFAVQKRMYDQVRILDTAGRELIRVNHAGGQAEIIPTEQLQRKDDRYYFQEAIAMDRGEVFVSDFDLNVEHGRIERPLKPVLRFATAVFDAAGERRGLLVLNYLGIELLNQIGAVAIPGSTLLLKSDGEYLLGLRSEDAWGWMLGHERTFARQFPAEWAEMRQRDIPATISDHGYFVARPIKLESPVVPQVVDEDSPERERSQNVAKRGALILVSFIPWADFYGRSTSLLWQLMLISAGAVGAVFVLAGFWARAAVIRREQAVRIVDSEARLRTLSGQLFSAQEAERRAISREIHDQLGQQATAISLDLKSSVRQADPARARATLERAIQETDQLLKSLHGIATRLRPAVLDDLGLRDAVESYLADFQTRAGILVDAELEIGDKSISPTIGENVYRIIQESLTNVLKHSSARSVAVEMETNERWLRLLIRDDGVGFSPEQGETTRLGLLGMRERVELLGGEFRIESAAGTGTEVHVRMPLASVRE